MATAVSQSEQSDLSPDTRAEHWEEIYRRRGETSVSWYQPRPSMSLELIESLGVAPETPVIDVGGGASTLVDELLDRGFWDVSVLDVSMSALALAHQRLGPTPKVHWLHQDLLRWRPSRKYGLWHDRAVFHFLFDPQDRRRYLQLLGSAIQPGGRLVMGTFAPDGPERCSNLPVARYSPEDLTSLLEDLFDITTIRREEHTTPAGTIQPFTWVVGQAIG